MSPIIDDAFELSRQRIWGIAYRSLSSVVDADDVVQEAWLRWNRTDKTAINNPAAWLTAVTANLAIDRLRVLRRERQRYVGPWLPSPVPSQHLTTSEGVDRTEPTEPVDPVRIDDDVVDSAALADDVTMGLLVILERLDPVERVVLVLIDVFRESFNSVATIVGRDPAACRQIAVRARRRVQDERRQRHRPTQAQRDLVCVAFSAAVATGDVDSLVRLLAPDAVLISDGGAQRHTARRPVVTPARIARFLINTMGRVPEGATVRGVELNGEQGFVWDVGTTGGRVVDGAIVLAIDDGVITGLFVQVNREKLQHLL